MERKSSQSEASYSALTGEQFAQSLFKLISNVDPTKSTLVELAIPHAEYRTLFVDPKIIRSVNPNAGVSTEILIAGSARPATGEDPVPVVVTFQVNKEALQMDVLPIAIPQHF
ncbi:MAG TPA: hypothetical protein VLG16_01165 [Candidatus Saccharimonadales bacterium]|nr:hypothetical protein [Candidatus Saccharimonadales bacterium]